MDDKDTLLVWLLKKADFLIGPETYQCGYCLATIEGPLQESWPHRCPAGQRLRKDRPEQEVCYEVEQLGQSLLVPPEQASYFLDIWEWAGCWDSSISTGAGQVRLLCQEYENYLLGDEQERKAKRHRQAALAAIRQALLNQQLLNGGQPITATVLFQNEQDLCNDALAIIGERRGVKVALVKLLGDLAPEVIKGPPSRGYPTWSLSNEILIEQSIIEDPGAQQVRLARAKEIMEARARELASLGQPAWQLRQFCLRYEQDVATVLELTGASPGDHKALAALLARWPDAFCVVGYQSGSAVWSLVAEGSKAQLYDRKFARFSGKKDS